MTRVLEHWGPAYYRITMVRGGPSVPCKIWYGCPLDPDTQEPLDRSPRWHCEAGGVLLDDPFRVIILIGDQPPIVKGERIDEAEYQFLLADAAWCKQHDPEAPEAQPRKRVDLNKLPPIF